METPCWVTGVRTEGVRLARGVSRARRRVDRPRTNELNQLIAVEKGVKNRSQQELPQAHHDLQKPALLNGISRTYQPRDEEGERFLPSPRVCRCARTTS